MCAHVLGCEGVGRLFLWHLLSPGGQGRGPGLLPPRCCWVSVSLFSKAVRTISIPGVPCHPLGGTVLLSWKAHPGRAGGGASEAPEGLWGAGEAPHHPGDVHKTEQIDHGPSPPLRRPYEGRIIFNSSQHLSLGLKVNISFIYFCAQLNKTLIQCVKARSHLLLVTLLCDSSP